MLQINERQKSFYERVLKEGSFEKGAGGLATTAWSSIRSRLWAFQRDVGARDRVIALHRERLGDVSQSRILDLGCGNGSALTLWLAENCGEYIGIDLAEHPINILSDTFQERGFHHARAIAMDFLDNPFPENHFDVVYAYAVIHHFKDTQVVAGELLRVLRPGGLILTYDPLQTEPINRLGRKIYRRWQTDRDWEWPFSRSTIDILRQHFEITDVRGIMGMSKFGLPFYLVPGLAGIGRSIARWGIAFDDRRARDVNTVFYSCWQAAMVLRKPDSVTSSLTKED